MFPTFRSSHKMQWCNLMGIATLHQISMTQKHTNILTSAVGGDGSHAVVHLNTAQNKTTLPSTIACLVSFTMINSYLIIIALNNNFTHKTSTQCEPQRKLHIRQTTLNLQFEGRGKNKPQQQQKPKRRIRRDNNKTA